MIESIIYFASEDTMGEAGRYADLFREWARSELAREFPGAEIDVRSEPGLGHIAVANDGDGRAEEAAVDFACRLWERCPWECLL